MIHPGVLRVWHAYSEPCEGRLYCLYLDVRGLVTTGVGNLVDFTGGASTPAEMAARVAHSISVTQALPWRVGAGGPLATPEQVALEWRRVKALQAAWGPQYYRDRTSLRLDDSAVDALVERTVQANARDLQLRHFPDWPTWPADAQLGALSLAWAVGTWLEKWPKFRAHCKARNWLGAAAESVLRDGLDTPDPSDDNPGVQRRNDQQAVAFLNAAAVDARRDGALERAECYWPLELVA